LSDRAAAATPVPAPGRPGTKAALSPTTQKIYADDWAAFSAWCAAHALAPLPAEPATVAAYLAARQDRLGSSGLRVVVAAIAAHHRQAGQAWSASDGRIIALLRARQADSKPRPAAALTAEQMQLLLSSCDADPGGRAAFSNLRDRALLLLGFAGGLRRSELVALDVEDLHVASSGLTLHIGRRKAGRDGQGRSLSIGRASQAQHCPVRAMEIWLRRSNIAYGPVFPRLTAAGTIEGRLTGNGVWKILRRRAALVGLQAPAGARLSPHGLRAGFMMAAAAQDTASLARAEA